MINEKQKLVDLCFEFAIKAAAHMHGKTNEEIAAWVSSNLKECGFPTYAVGSSWGVLNEKV
jgi:hypothetical protein